jgi:hypothetical protein
VLKGLGAEDRVVVNGLMLVRPGITVEAQGPTSEARGSKPEIASPGKVQAKAE